MHYKHMNLFFFCVVKSSFWIASRLLVLSVGNQHFSEASVTDSEFYVLRGRLREDGGEGRMKGGGDEGSEGLTERERDV